MTAALILGGVALAAGGVFFGFVGWEEGGRGRGVTCRIACIAGVIAFGLGIERLFP